MIRRTCSGVDLKSKLKIIALIPTDFPEPVVPATNKCGIFPKSTTIGCPAISTPNAKVNGECAC